MDYRSSILLRARTLCAAGVLAAAGCMPSLDDGPDRPGDAPSAGQAGAGQSPAGGGAGTPSDTANPKPECTAIMPGASPIRRLTTREYSNTARDLLGDTTNPGSALPAQADSKHNLFGNDADEQASTSLLIEKYQSVAEAIAQRATADATALSRLHGCTRNLATSAEEACARSIAASIAPRAYRRTVSTAEVDELLALYRAVRTQASGVTFASGVAAMLEAMLQAPEFLYRVEQGVAGPDPTLKRIVGREMATRLAYLFWQTMPDEPLFKVADSGMLDTAEGVREQARRMLDDPRTRQTVAFFFDNLLPIPDLVALTRDAALFPTFSSAIGAAMRQEVQRLIEYEIFENSAAVGPYGAGSWPALLSSPYTFVNNALFDFYGAATFAPGTSVSGPEFRRVNLNSEQRLGLLTLGGVMAGGTTSNMTNPVLRGAFIVNKLMCLNIELPVGLSVSPPEPYTGKTARERFTKHRADAACAGCHALIDPLGMPFENFDAVGLYRATERWTDPMTKAVYDSPIDASGSVPGTDGTAKNAVELARLLASSSKVGDCFASHWIQFGYGRSIDDATDACTLHSVRSAFKDAGYNIKQLLLALTQTHAFLYRAAQ